MSRLIDADALIKDIKNAEIPHGNIVGAVLAYIKTQPTIEAVPVVDTEKVIDQLMTLHIEGYCPDEDDNYECVLDKTCTDCYRDRIREIIRKGGAE